MKIYKDLQQQSDEWFMLKYGKIGGSALKHLMVSKPVHESAIYNDLLSARFEDYEYEEAFTSRDMERGNMYEPLARAEYERVHNVTVEQYGWIEMNNGIAGLSPDGIIGTKLDRAIEIKCPNRITHTAYLRNPLSMVEEYVWQVVMYFTVLDKLKTLHFISYRPENRATPLLVYNVTRDTIVQVSAKETDTIGNLVKKAKYKLKQLEATLEKDVAFLLPKF
ncbi:YqaJ-like recombinase protein [Dysgonomonas alginatilytica]|uniref:YqaJ-like recombinase protein n=1 Tax=Dysgonomonas alginatilytica TaxID=1605892 RepID=A0A2V3PTP9_9BACT|nr:YqaJ viral recombinase family protein [Dysgonomonas alginatilytica]PXV66911.1 YqaJ-like recombinase protein [Dysgonomonas alginatilytica]